MTVISVVVKTVNVYITNIMPSNPETLIFNVSVNTHECCFFDWHSPCSVLLGVTIAYFMFN